jgi:hypothetical protein
MVLRLMDDKRSDQFSKRETQQRFDAALRGARIAGPKHNEDIKQRSLSKRAKKPARKKER